jgi:hypothetical protein
MVYRLSVPLSDALGERAEELPRRLRSGELTMDRADQVSELISELADDVPRYNFRRPAEAFKLGLASRGMIDLGIRSTIKTIRMAIRQTLPRLNPSSSNRLRITSMTFCRRAERRGQT